MNPVGRAITGVRIRHIATLTVCVIAAGLICRLAPLGLSPWSRKWSGSVLWGALFWCLAALVTRDDQRRTRLLLGALGTFGSEMLKLVHLAPLNALRKTGAGGFLLGSIFSWYDMVAYIAGLALMELTSIAVATRPRWRK